MRSFGLDIIGAGQFMGSLLLIGGTLGVLAGGFLADRFGSADRRWYAWLPAIAWLITAPFFLVGLLSSSLWTVWPLLVIPNALNILWLGPVTTAVQHLVERPMRATASACFLLINNFIGLGVGRRAGHGVRSAKVELERLLHYPLLQCSAFTGRGGARVGRLTAPASNWVSET
jgi:hypothetical protein